MRWLILLLLMISSTLQAKIQESDKIDILLDCVDQTSIVFLDITSTLYAPSVTMADKRWRIYFSELAKKTIDDQEQAQKLSHQIEGMLVHQIPKVLIEENAPSIVKSLHDQKIPTFGLTKKNLSTPYSSNFGEVTSNHLMSLGINLQKSLDYCQFWNQQGDNYGFAFGIIFTRKMPLSIALQDFIPTLNFSVKKLIVIDNSLEHLQELENFFDQKMDFLGIRYSRADSKKAAFDPILGVIQLLNYVKNQTVLSDEEAFQVKNTSQTDWEEELRQWILIRSIH